MEGVKAERPAKIWAPLTNRVFDPPKPVFVCKMRMMPASQAGRTTRGKVLREGLLVVHKYEVGVHNQGTPETPCLLKESRTACPSTPASILTVSGVITFARLLPLPSQLLWHKSGPN